MADLSIRKDFIEGIQEIFVSLFNEGVLDGIYLYLLSDKTTTNIYSESKYKIYKKPKLLVSKAVITPVQGKQDVEYIKNNALFVVPLKSFMDNEVDITNKGLFNMRKGIIKFHDVYYTIKNINPKAYIEDVFLLYEIVAEENLEIGESIRLEEQ